LPLQKLKGQTLYSVKARIDDAGWVVFTREFATSCLISHFPFLTERNKKIGPFMQLFRAGKIENLECRIENLRNACGMENNQAEACTPNGTEKLNT
jgi:hypothetical protein